MKTYEHYALVTGNPHPGETWGIRQPKGKKGLKKPQLKGENF